MLSANADLVKGGGVDDAIHRACSPRQNKLKQLLKTKILSNGGPIADGGVVDTPAFGGLANNVKFMPVLIAFPSISTGAFNFPREKAAQIATSTILNWLADQPQGAPAIDETLVFTPTSHLTFSMDRLQFDMTSHSTSPPATKKKQSDEFELMELETVPGPSTNQPAQVSSDESRQVRI
ncbi:hypothetical protein niasHT_021999 [Heterodera trifolii]|uniref:Macro domain-containing protein n=1 Tax=Heterodera trifolii TaxID=157864 RepID=A0ABD2JN87_9BILA